MLPWTTSVHIQNGILIGSAISAQLTAESLYFTMGRPKLPPFMGICTPSNTQFIGFTRVHNPNNNLIGSAVFAGLTIITDRQTDHATPSVTIGHIYIRSTVMQLKNSYNLHFARWHYNLHFARWHTQQAQGVQLYIHITHSWQWSSQKTVFIILVSQCTRATTRTCPNSRIRKTDRQVVWVKVLLPTQHKIGHFGQVLLSQSLGTVLKKLNLTQQKPTTQEQKGLS